MKRKNPIMFNVIRFISRVPLLIRIAGKTSLPDDSILASVLIVPLNNKRAKLLPLGYAWTVRPSGVSAAFRTIIPDKIFSNNRPINPPIEIHLGNVILFLFLSPVDAAGSEIVS